MLLPIEKLADIISQNTIAQIENTLRVLYISLCKPNLPEEKITKLHEKQKLYGYARNFLLAHASLPEAWSSSPICFSQLATWFHTQTDIIDHEKWAMQAWYFRLRRSTLNNIASSLVTLGEAFFEEPYQFAAFLLWLLKHNITLATIQRSQLLHRYYAYYAALEIETLQQTYALLENISDNITTFLQGLETAPGVFGFGLYNLLGVALPSSSTVDMLPLEQNNYSPFAPAFLNWEMGVELFDLFRWTFIKKLNLNDFFYQTVIQKILSSELLTTPFLEGLSTAILTEAVDVEDAGILLRITAECPAVHEWVRQEPFLIYGMLDLNISERTLVSAINMLCTQEKYKQLSHINWLVALSSNVNPFLRRQIASYILDLVLPFGATLSDEIISQIRSLDIALQQCCENKAREYLKALSDAIVKFIDTHSDYHDIERLWGSTLSQINLFRSLYPMLFKKIHYPQNKYALRGWVLHRCCIETNAFSLQAAIDLMCDEFSAKKRTLQEVFSVYKNSDFQKAILNWVTAQDSSAKFFYEPFGNDETVVARLFFKKDTAALVLVAEKIPSALKEMLFVAVDSDQLNLLDGLLKLRVRGVKSLLPSIARYAAEKNKWEAVQLLCGLSDDVDYAQSVIRENNINFYIKILLDEKTRRGVVRFPELKHLISRKNSADDTLLHLAARDGSYKTVCTCFELFKSVSVTGDIILFLHHKNHVEQIAQCEKDTRLARRINQFLQEQRERLQPVHSSPIPSLHSFFKRKRDEISLQPENADIHALFSSAGS